MRDRLSLICVVVVLAALIGCKFDFSGLMLSSDPVVEEPIVSEIPEEIKELVWANYEALVESLLELGVEDTEQAEELLARIRTRQEQEQYYTKYVDAGGIAIVGAKTLTNEVMLEAQDIALKMTEKRPLLRTYLAPETGFYFILTDIVDISKGGYYFPTVKELPEWWVWELQFKSSLIHIKGAMCLEVTAEHNRFVCTSYAAKVAKIQTRPHGVYCDNFWCDTDLFLQDWTTFAHEMAHAVHYAARKIDSKFQSKLETAYQNALKNELWDNGKVISGEYAMTNANEYWAVATEYWFFTHRSINYNGHEIPERDREELKERDPLIYNLLAEWYPTIESLGRTPP